MTHEEASSLLHTAMWSLADNKELMCAWFVEDVYVRFDRLPREDRLTFAGWERDRMRKAAIYTPLERRVRCFVIWLLENVQ